MDRSRLMSDTFPLCAYYVRSPSTSSRATARNDAATNQSAMLSRCSSLRSNSSYIQDPNNKGNGPMAVDFGHDESEDWFVGKRVERGCWYNYFSFERSSSCLWIGLQLTWRILGSMAIALLLFYLATKPPTPKISIQVGRMHMFRLTEGVDGHGVPTKTVTCNCSMDVLIENSSKFFGLHLRPPFLQISFNRLHFAVSQGPEMYAGSQGLTLYKLYVGTRNKPVYGAGHSMQDRFLSPHGLPLVLRAAFTSEVRVVWDLIKPRFHHEAVCSLVLSYDQKHRVVRTHNARCNVLHY